MSSYPSTPTTLHTSSTPTNRPLADFFSDSPSQVASFAPTASSVYSKPESHYVGPCRNHAPSHVPAYTLVEPETAANSLKPSPSRASTVSRSSVITYGDLFASDAFTNPRPAPPPPFVIPGDHDPRRSQSVKKSQVPIAAGRVLARTNTQPGLSRTLSSTITSGLKRLNSSHRHAPSIEKSAIRSPTGFMADSRAYADGIPLDVANAISLTDAQRRHAEFGASAFVRTAATIRPSNPTRSQRYLDAAAAAEHRMPRPGNKHASWKPPIPPPAPAPAHVPAPAPTARQTKTMSAASGMTTWTQFIEAGFATPAPSIPGNIDTQSWKTADILQQSLTPRTIPAKSSLLPLPLKTSKSLPAEPNPPPPHNSMARAQCDCYPSCMEELYEGLEMIPDGPTIPPASVVEAIARATRLREREGESENDEDEWSCCGSSVATTTPRLQQQHQIYSPANEMAVRDSDRDEVRRLYGLKFQRPGRAGSDHSDDTTVDHRVHESHVSILVTSHPTKDIIESVHKRVPLPDEAGRLWESLEGAGVARVEETS